MSIISEIQNKALDEGRLKAEAVNSYKVVSVRPRLEITSLIEVLSFLDGKSPSEFIYKNFGKALEDFTLSSNEHIECLKTALDNCIAKSAKCTFKKESGVGRLIKDGVVKFSSVGESDKSSRLLKHGFNKAVKA